MNQKSYDGTASLYLIPTPIGNLEDITIRSLNTLKQVDYILCEDTRTTGSLLKKYDIKKRLISCHEFNENNIKDRVVEDLASGMNIGLVTDQGTPIISDPGYKIVQAVVAKNYNVIALPGSTAFVPALIASGLSPAPFMFYGFLNAKESKQRQELQQLKNVSATLIFYEAPHRISKTLKNILEVWGDRQICISREISKLYEEVYRGSISELLLQTEGMKGEIVLIVEGNRDIIHYDHLTVIEHVKLYLEDGLTEKEAIKKAAKERNIAKSIVYNEYHSNKEVK